MSALAELADPPLKPALFRCWGPRRDTRTQEEPTPMLFARRCIHALAVCCLLGSSAKAADKRADKPAAPEKVSYFKQVRPIFQANCQGCHQPAKSRGDYAMTSFKALLDGGASGSKAIVPGKPNDSKLLTDITPVKGKARMPEGKKPLHESEIELVK